MSALTYVQAKGTNGGAQTIAYTSNTTGGSFLLCWYAVENDSPVYGGGVPTDTLGNTWVAIGVPQTFNGYASNAAFWVCYKNNASGGANTITLPVNTNPSGLQGCAEFTGQASSSPLDLTSFNVGFTSAASTTIGSVGMSKTNEEIISIMFLPAGFTLSSPSTGFTVSSVSGGNGSAMAYGAFASGTQTLTGALSPTGDSCTSLTLSVQSTSTPPSAITLLQAVGSGSSTGTYTSNTTPGSLLVGVFRVQGSVVTVSDTTNGNWTKAANSADSFNQIWFFVNGAGGVKPTVSGTGASAIQAMVIAEFSGVLVVSPLDQNSAGTGTGTSSYSTSPAISITDAVELLIGGVCNSSANGLTNTPTVGWTNALAAGAGGSGNAFMNYQVTSAKGSFINSGNLVSNVNWDSTIASFIGATQPSPSPAIGWSPVDSRVAVIGFGPGANTGIVDSQGNTIYSAQNPPFSGNSQVSDNAAIPPVDSRVSKPVDSRTNKPVNSRVAPPFGEAGEP
jgi:hypothetical protein